MFQRLKGFITLYFILANLKFLSVVLNHVSVFKRHLKSNHPCGTEFVFNAKMLFYDKKKLVVIHILFAEGRMKTGRGTIDDPGSCVIFKGLREMRNFFKPGSDTLAMLMDNEMTVIGNTSYLFKFGFMSSAILRNNRKKSPRKLKKIELKKRVDIKKDFEFESVPDQPDMGGLIDPYFCRTTLDDIPRIREQLVQNRNRMPEICVERPFLLTEYLLKNKYPENKEKFSELLYAKAIHYVLTNKEPIIHENDILAGTTTSKKTGVVLYPEAGAVEIWPELLTLESRELNPYKISYDAIEKLNFEILPYWMDLNIREYTRAKNKNPLSLQIDDKLAFYFLWKTQAVSHTIIDLPMVLNNGLVKIRRKYQDKLKRKLTPKEKDFCHSAIIAIGGILNYSSHCGKKAIELTKGLDLTDNKALLRKEELKKIAEACQHSPAHPPRSLFEAVQATWLLFVAEQQENRNNAMSFGRLDLWWEPYFQRDYSRCRTEAEKKHYAESALELVCAFMLKATDHLPLVPNIGNRLFGGSSSVQSITLGGEKTDGSSAVGAMTWIFLKATELLKIRDPNINARYSRNVNSKEYLKRLCDVNSITKATPAIHNDDEVIATLMTQGFNRNSARDYSIVGCVEPVISGRHFGHTASILFNLVAPLEMALNNGRHYFLDENLGPGTGKLSSFLTFEDFFNAYRIQLKFLLDLAIDGNNMLGRSYQEIRPFPLLSALISGPLRKAKDLIYGGAVYNSSGLGMIGFADVVDSLSAIDEFVFEKKEFSFEDFMKKISRNFFLNEELRNKIITGAPKYGQNHPRIEAITQELLETIYSHCRSRTNYRGGKYFPGYWSMSNHVAFGLLSGALPSGKKKRMPFAPGITPSSVSPVPLTEQMHSVAKLDSTKMPNNMTFNVKISPSQKELRNEILDNICAYVLSYFELGGMQLQLNIITSETLKKAVQKPDEYRDLLVRISGYNAYFTELNKDIQQEIINRAEYRV